VVTPLARARDPAPAIKITASLIVWLVPKPAHTVIGLKMV
jgi:hypothetical protein